MTPHVDDSSFIPLQPSVVCVPPSLQFNFCAREKRARGINSKAARSLSITQHIFLTAIKSLRANKQTRPYQDLNRRIAGHFSRGRNCHKLSKNKLSSEYRASLSEQSIEDRRKVKWEKMSKWNVMRRSEYEKRLTNNRVVNPTSLSSVFCRCCFFFVLCKPSNFTLNLTTFCWHLNKLLLAFFRSRSVTRIFFLYASKDIIVTIPLPFSICTCKPSERGKKY